MFTLPVQIFFCAKNVIVKLMVNCNINCICMPTNMEQKVHNLPFARFAMFNFQVNYFQSLFYHWPKKYLAASHIINEVPIPNFQKCGFFSLSKYWLINHLKESKLGILWNLKLFASNWIGLFFGIRKVLSFSSNFSLFNFFIF